jgi:transposase-like protein
MFLNKREVPPTSDLWYTLSPQQRKIYNLLSQGLSQKQVAETLGITTGSVKVQVIRIKRKQQRIQVDKNEIKVPLQYQSAFFDTSTAVLKKDEALKLIAELESSKGLKLTPLQKDAILMKTGGDGDDTIGKSLGITSGQAQDIVKQARMEIMRVQSGDSLAPEISDCEFIGNKRTVAEAQVLSCLNIGFSVKGTAQKLGKTENSVRAIMHRSGTSIKKLKEQRSNGPRFRNNYYKPPDSGSISLMRRYFSGMLTLRERVEAEIILRSEGLIRSVPAIMRNNSRLLSMLSAQKRKKVFHVTENGEAALKKSLGGMRGNMLDYAGASLILVNHYAREENDNSGSGFIHTYAVDRRFWPTIQAAAGSVSSTDPVQGPVFSNQYGTVGRNSSILLRDLSTNETLLVSISSAHSSITSDHIVLSPKAPLAEALQGHKAGDCISLEVVKGTRIDYEILEIQDE